MEIPAFQDFSDSLIPVPGLSAGDTPGPAGDSSFSNYLQQFSDAGETGTSNRSPNGIFNLATTSPTGISPPPLPSEFQALLTSRPSVPHEDTLIPGSESEELMEICRDLEGFLTGILLRNLGKGFAGSSQFSRTWESSVYHDMFFYELSQAIGKQPPGLGIADMLYDDIIMKAGGMIDEVV